MTFKVKDHYFKKAKKENYLARSVYKLEEIDAKFKILRKGGQVLDLGYYPGSWIQYTAKTIGPSGLVVGIDIKEINRSLSGLKNVKLFSRDAFIINNLNDLEVNTPFDIILSDMAPNTSGIKSVDQTRSLDLVQKVFSLLPLFLKANGDFVIKIFESADAQKFLKEQKNLFATWHLLRPKSTRSCSKEFFAIAKGFKGP